jgi:hypothetical protein
MIVGDRDFQIFINFSFGDHSWSRTVRQFSGDWILTLDIHVLSAWYGVIR